MSIRSALFFLASCIFALVSTSYAGITYYHTDQLGSPVAATDENGDVLWKVQYYPFGDKIVWPLSAAGTTDAADNTRYFTAHVDDMDTGLTYMQARYYDPVIGRFLGTDPIEFVESNLATFNRFSYANNNPYKFVDKDGRCADMFSGSDLLCHFDDAVTEALEPLMEDLLDEMGAEAIPEGERDPGGELANEGPGNNLAEEIAAVGVAAIATRNPLGKRRANLPKPGKGKGAVAPDQRDPKRVWTKNEKRDGLEDRDGQCDSCGRNITVEEARGHHIKRHADGGRTSDDNMAILCDPCHIDIHK